MCLACSRKNFNHDALLGPKKGHGVLSNRCALKCPAARVLRVSGRPPAERVPAAGDICVQSECSCVLFQLCWRFRSRSRKVSRGDITLRCTTVQSCSAGRVTTSQAGNQKLLTANVRAVGSSSGEDLQHEQGADTNEGINKQLEEALKTVT